MTVPAPRFVELVTAAYGYLTGRQDELKATFGHDIWQLTTPKWEAVETDGWEMTSIPAYILQAKGAYRMPNSRLFSFVICDAVEWAPGAAV